MQSSSEINKRGRCVCRYDFSRNTIKSKAVNRTTAIHLSGPRRSAVVAPPSFLLIDCRNTALMDSVDHQTYISNKREAVFSKDLQSTEFFLESEFWRSI